MRPWLVLLCCTLLGVAPAWGQGEDGPLPTEADIQRFEDAITPVLNLLQSDNSRLAVLGDELNISHHDFDITLDPATQQLSAVTREEVDLKLETKQLHFQLFRDFKISRITVFQDGQPVPASFSTTTLESDTVLRDFIARMEAGEFLPFDPLPPFDVATLMESVRDVQLVTIQLGSFTHAGQHLTVEFEYAGSIADIATAPFEDEAIFLDGGRFWFPDVYGPWSTFTLDVTIPADWQAWSQGKWEADQYGAEPTRTMRYVCGVPQGQIVLLAGQYQVDRQTLDGIEFTSFLFPETAERVKDQPLMAKSIEYVRFFADHVGPYPYESFAIIETHAPVGQGYPGFTLLGSDVIGSHFLDPYSLGHEILHCWFGNYIAWNGEGGNWAEGITYCLANLYYDEVTQGEEFARQARKRAMEELSYTLRWEDVPTIEEFSSSSQFGFNPGAAQDIGYNKLGLLIHGWRKTLGDEAFFALLGRFLDEYGGRTARLMDLTGLYYDALKAEGKVSLEKKAWLERYEKAWYQQKGMPFLVLDHVFLTRDPDTSTYTGELKLRVDQFEGFALPPAHLLIYDGEVESPELVYVDEQLQWTDKLTLESDFHVARPPNWLEIDPEYDQLRWIPDSEKTPCLEFLRKTGPSSIVMNQALVTWLTEQNLNLPAMLGGRVPLQGLTPDRATAEQVAQSNLLAIGIEGDDNWMQDLLTPPFGIAPGDLQTVALEPLLDLDGNDAIFRLVKNESDPITCRGVVYGKDRESVLALLKKLPFYPMESWVTLKDGKVTGHGRDKVELRSLRYPLWDYPNNQE